MEDKRQVAELKVAGKAVTTWTLVKGSKNKITLGCPQRKPCSCILKLMLDSRLPLEVAIRTFAQWGEASFMTQVPAWRITENFAEVYKRIRRYYAPLLQRSIQPAPAYASHEQKHTASVQYPTWSHKLQKTMHLHSTRRSYVIFWCTCVYYLISGTKQLRKLHVDLYMVCTFNFCDSVNKITYIMISVTLRKKKKKIALVI